MRNWETMQAVTYTFVPNYLGLWILLRTQDGIDWL